MESNNSNSKWQKLNLGRRNFLKIAPAGAAAAGIGMAISPSEMLGSEQEKEFNPVLNEGLQEHDDFPYEIRDDYKPLPSYSSVHGHAFFGEALKVLGVEVDDEAVEQGKRFMDGNNYHFDPNKKGFDQKAKAVMSGAWALCNTGSGPMPGAVGDFGLMSWDNNADKCPTSLMDNNFVQHTKCEFDSKEEAANVIKRAARLYGADLVGITKRDARWDYSINFNPVPPLARKIVPMGPEQTKQLQEIGGENMKNAMDSHTPDKWLHDVDKTAGFTPKTVIVMAVEMDYEGISCSPNEISSGVVGEGYSKMTKVAHQMAVMIRGLGYNAIPCGNDTGMSIPYAIAAGLGEGSRMGQLVTYKYGPRVRLLKVYTDFDFVEYDKPKTFGVGEFCVSCKRCAEACPSDAITYDDHPSFEPTHEHKDNAYFNAVGVKKYYLDSKKCFKQWADSQMDCANCITSCPYNKPDFWHHQMINKIGAVLPGAAHDIMREMDIIFGYGNVDDPDAVDRFFDPKGRNYDGM